MRRAIRRFFARPTLWSVNQPQGMLRHRQRLRMNCLEERCVPAIFTVDSIADLGAGTLRQAIINANASVGVPDTIVFDTSKAPFNGPATISLDTALPFISDDLTITGTGAANLTINRNVGAGDFRILGVTDGTSKVINSTISGLTITGGQFFGGLGSGFVMDNEVVTLNSVVIANNLGDFGPGIGVGVGGQLTVNNSTISGNFANMNGGGIYLNNDTTFVLNGSTISNNTTQGTNGGGGIMAFASSQGNWTIRNSTISGNVSFSLGGGMTVGGAGIANLNILNSTITENQASTYGGGLFIDQATTNVTLSSTIVANNIGPATSLDISASGTVTANNSLIGSKVGIAVYVDNNSLEGDDTSPLSPMLNPLANNGGETMTQLPMTTSPAKNAGVNSSPSVQFDQRGNVRSFGQTDVGAVELSATDLGVAGTPTARGTFANITSAGGTTYTFTITYEDAGGGLTGFGLDDVRVTAPNGYNKTPTSFNVVSNTGTMAVVQYTIPSKSSPTPWNIADNDTYTISMEPGAPTDGVLAVPAGSNGQFRVLVANLKVTNTLNAGTGSLRQAILDANAIPGPDTITFDPAIFDGVTTQTITLSSTIAITGDTNIQGLADKTKLVISGGNAVRLFNIAQTGVFHVQMSGMTLTNAKASDTTRGAAIAMADETLTLNNVDLTNNVHSASRAGAISMTGAGVLNISNALISGNSCPNASFFGGAFSITAGTFNLSDSVVTGNSGGSGGAILVNLATLNVDRCTFDNNMTVGAAGWRGGGAIYAVNALLNVANSTFSSNVVANSTTTTVVGGGGILYVGASPTGADSVIRNSTFSGNMAQNSGGGILMYAMGGTVKVFNCTISGNSTSVTGVNQGGGGLAHINSVGKFEMASTIISDNTSASLGPDMFNTVLVSTPPIVTNSIIEQNIDTAFDPASSGNQFVDPGLGALQNNGGPTLTMLPANPGPAIDMGSNPIPSLNTDQRGLPRTYGRADVGAAEFIPLGKPSATGTFANVTTAGATTHTVTITYVDDATSGDNKIQFSSLGDNDVRIFAPDGSSFLAKLKTPMSSPDVSPLTATYEFTPPGGDWTPDDGGKYSISIDAGSVTDTNGNAVPTGVIGSFLVDLSRTIVVTNTNDNGMGSLRQAIIDANLTSSPDTITFANGPGQAFEGAATIKLTTGQLAVTTSLSIVGTGSSKLTIDGNANARHLNIDGAGILNVSLSKLTLTNGSTDFLAFDGIFTGMGGSIIVADELLTLDDVRFTNNKARALGGAIGLNGANATITGTNVVFDNNSGVGNASGRGGAIFARQSTSKISLTSSTISNNKATSHGGGIYFVSGGQLTLDRTTISGNIADSDASGAGDGGGIYFFGTTNGTGITIKNSTISGNFAVNGGGIALKSFGGSMQLQNSTVAFNDAFTSGGGVAVISLAATPGTVTMVSSIISNNTVAMVIPSDFNGAVIANGKNWIGDQNGAVITGFPLFGDPMLDPTLALNGAPAGAPLTHKLLTGSLAIDQGENPFNYPLDGTGHPRIYDNPMIANAADGTDIGAYEAPAPLPPPTVVSVLTNGVASGQHSLVTSIVINFSQLVTIANPSMAFVINRTAGATGGDAPATGTVGFTVTGLNGSNQGTSVTITFNGTGAVGVDPGNSLRDGKYEITIVAAQVVGGAGLLDGNANGKYDPLDPNMDNNVSNTWRLYGDGNGDGAVTASDFNDFRLFYGSIGNPAAAKYDFNNDGAITASDFNNFRTRYGLSGYNIP